MTVLGLDLSSTATGICQDPGLDIAPQTGTWKPKGDLMHRARAMRDQVRYLLPYIDVLVIEAIATRHTQTAIAIATVHALVLDQVIDEPHVRLVTVTPAQLKKWATGKGNADKTAMVTSAMKAGWHAPDDATDDQADAWWLWTLGHATRGTWKVPLTAYRSAILADLAKETS